MLLRRLTRQTEVGKNKDNDPDTSYHTFCKIHENFEFWKLPCIKNKILICCDDEATKVIDKTLPAESNS